MDIPNDKTITTLVVARDSGPDDGLFVKTPFFQPDVIIQTITPLVSILIRATRVFCQSLVSGLTASTAGSVMNIDTLRSLDFKAVVILAGFSAVVCALQNTIELLGKLDQKYPLFRG